MVLNNDIGCTIDPNASYYNIDNNQLMQVTIALTVLCSRVTIYSLHIGRW
jgi:hypothetical protein